MNAGAYNRRITIEHRVSVRNENLITTEEWLPYYTNYAYMNKLSGSEFWAASEVAAQNTVRFTLRWHPKLEDLNTKDYRIVVGTRIYNLTNIDDVKFRHETVKISGTEVV